MALVSVVVPAYNGSAHIAESLRGVMAQTHPNIELIVVDDGSDDDTVAIACATAPSATIIRQRNARVSAARNAGLAAATGEFICFLDQDDIWHPQHVSAQLRCFDEAPDAGAVVSPYQHWYPKADSSYTAPAQAWPDAPATRTDPAFSGWVYHQFLLDCWALTSATMIRHSVLLQHGAFDVERPFSEDWDLWLRLSRQVPFVKLNHPPVLYRQHAVQGSRVARPIDWRTELLLSAVQQHGYASRDGRRVAPAVFNRQIAHYQMQFGCHHLRHGDRRLGVRSLFKAWRRRPLALRYLALAAAGSAGWCPVAA